MTIGELAAELAGAYGLDADRVAFIVAQVRGPQGFCPFTVDGRQYAATAYLRAPGYTVQAIEEEEV